MNRFVAALALLAFAAPAVAHASAKAAPPLKLTKAEKTARINAAVKYTQKKLSTNRDVFVGWNAGATKTGMRAIAKTGSVYVSTGDELSTEDANGVVSFNTKGKPSRLTWITQD